MSDLDFIKGFSKISIAKACRDLNINRTSLLLGRLKEEKVKKVRRYLECEVAKLYLGDNNGKENSTL